MDHKTASPEWIAVVEVSCDHSRCGGVSRRVSWPECLAREPLSGLGDDAADRVPLVRLWTASEFQRKRFSLAPDGLL